MNFYESQLATFLRSEGHLWSVPGGRGFGDNRAFTLLELLLVGENGTLTRTESHSTIANGYALLGNSVRVP